jgi:putative ABC transport system permease protein
VKADGEPLGLVSAVRGAVWGLDKDLPVSDLRTMEEVLSESLARQRFSTLLLGVFGGLALVLAAVGIYGVMSYTVTQRRHEIGIRMALGARAGVVLWMVMREILTLILIGIALGLPAAIAATQWISSMLFGLTPTDPLTIMFATLFMITVATFAGYLPARRASQVDPMVALRYE